MSNNYWDEKAPRIYKVTLQYITRKDTVVTFFNSDDDFDDGRSVVNPTYASILRLEKAMNRRLIDVNVSCFYNLDRLPIITIYNQCR